MKNKKILAAIAAVSVLSLATGASVFAMSATPEANTKDEAIEVETDAAADEAEAAETETETAETEEEAAEETSAEAENAEEETTEADEAAEKIKPPHAEKDKPLAHVDMDVTDFFYEIKDSINVDKYGFIPESILENWDNIKKIKVHIDFNKDGAAEKPAAPAKAEGVKEVKGPHHVDLDVTDIFYEFKNSVNVDKYDIIPDTVKENWDNIRKIKVHVDFNKPAKDEAEKPEKPTPPAKDKDGEKPTPPTPPTPPAKNEDKEKPTPPTPPTPHVKNEDKEKPEHPTPPHKLHEAEKAAGAEAEETTDAEISE